MMFVVLRCRLLPLFAVLAALLVLSGLSGCAGNQAKLEGSWTTTPFEGELWVFEFNADRTAKFSGNRQRPTDCVWTRIDDIDQLKAFVAKQGVSLQAAVRAGTPLPYAPDGGYLVLVDSGAGKGFPLLRIVSLDQSTLVVELEVDGSQQTMRMQRVE